MEPFTTYTTAIHVWNQKMATNLAVAFTIYDNFAFMISFEKV